MNVCRQRDPSGLYAAAELSGSQDVPGVSYSYEAPEQAVLTLDTGALSIDECVGQVMKLLKGRGII